MFERRVLWWTTLLVLLGTGLWLVALATPYWIIHIAGPEHERGLVWGHSGVWRKCDLVESSEQGLRWECWYTLSFQSALIRSELSLAGVAVLLTLAAFMFSWYSINHPKYTFRRLAAVLHLLTAVCILAVIQLVDGGSRMVMIMDEEDTKDRLLYGYSYLLAWCSFLISLAASGVFLLASRKRKLLDSDNVNFTHQKLDINVSSYHR